MKFNQIITDICTVLACLLIYGIVAHIDTLEHRAQQIEKRGGAQ